MSWNNFHRWDKNRPIYFNLGLVISLSIANLAINYECLRPEYTEAFSLDELIDFNSTSVSEHTEQIEKKPSLPTKRIDPLTARITTSENEYTENENVMPVETISEIPTNSLSFISDQPPVFVSETPTPKVEASAYVHFAEVMPCLLICDDLEDEEARQNCTKTALLKYIYKNLKYPTIAVETGIEGTVVVSFVINKYGQISTIQTVRDIGGGCGEAVVKAITNLTGWVSGRQNNRPVNVKYTIPVRFKLNQ